MGILIEREEDSALYKDTYEEAQRIIRISDEVRISLEKIDQQKSSTPTTEDEDDNNFEKLTSSKLANKLGLSTTDLLEQLTQNGYLSKKDNNFYLTDKAKTIGAEFKKGKFGFYFLWPENIAV